MFLGVPFLMMNCYLSGWRLSGDTCFIGGRWDVFVSFSAVLVLMAFDPTMLQHAAFVLLPETDPMNLIFSVVLVSS